MAKVAWTPSQFVHKISANLACERAPDCVLWRGRKEAGGDSREWSGEEKSHLARFASLPLFYYFFRTRREPVHSTVPTLPDYHVGLSRSSLATFEQRFRVLTTSSKVCLSEQRLSKI